MNLKKTFLFLSLLLVFSLQASTLENGVSKKDFHYIISTIKKAYEPVFRNLEKQFVIEADWNNEYWLAEAASLGGIDYVRVSGALARYKHTTNDIFLYIICHEIGHHLGKSGEVHAYLEGQADYFASLKCMKRVMRFYGDNDNVVERIFLPQQVKSECSKQFSDNNDYNICLRIAKAAEDYGNLLVLGGWYPGITKKVSLLTPDDTIAASINELHPGPQCRTDTILQGALCNVDIDESLDAEDEFAGLCSKRNGHSVGLRPPCWFVP